MKIDTGKFATFTYTLFEKNLEENIFENVTKNNPMGVVIGQQKLLPLFEKGLIGKIAGDKFEIKIDAEDAFGSINEQAIHEIPKKVFEIDGKIDESLFEIGNKLPMRDRSGNVLDGYVKSVTDTDITLDFNHPLAGKNIVFKGEIIEVREATHDELNPPSHSCCGGGGSCSTEKHEDNHSCGCESNEDSCCSSDSPHNHEEHSCGCN